MPYYQRETFHFDFNQLHHIKKGVLCRPGKGIPILSEKKCHICERAYTRKEQLWAFSFKLHPNRSMPLSDSLLWAQDSDSSVSPF